MQKYLYQDTLNTQDDMQIERDLAKLGTEVSKILSNQMCSETDILLSLEDEDKLTLIYSIMGFRSLRSSIISVSPIQMNSKSIIQITKRTRNSNNSGKEI